MLTKQLTFLSLALLLILPVSAAATQVDKQMVPFAGQDMHGNPLDLKDIIGNKAIMLVFWASWCPNCKVEAPKINDLYKKYGDHGLAIIGIDVGYNDTVKRARVFMEETKMAYPVIFDSDHSITNTYKVQGVPTVIIADRSGTIRFRNFKVPDITEEDYQKLIAP